MDDLDQREAFLKAIFDAPDDDLPRLVFADWLDDHGESAWAELIRVGCRLTRWNLERDGSPQELANRQRALEREVFTHSDSDPVYGGMGEVVVRGFLSRSCIGVTADLLSTPSEFRSTAARTHPEWYGADRLKVTAGLIASSKPISTILTSPVTQRVTHLDLSGAVIHGSGADEIVSDADPRTGEFDLRLAEFSYRPTVTLQAVEALVGARECRRIVHLDLRNNDLDNDAARAIVRSPYLVRIESLNLFDGNQLRGRTWQQLLDKFGEDVVQ